MGISRQQNPVVCVIHEMFSAVQLSGNMLEMHEKVVSITIFTNLYLNTFLEHSLVSL